MDTVLDPATVELVTRQFGVWGIVGLAVFTALRAAAATLSKHLSDDKLGRFAPTVNWLGGNTKYAANNPEAQ